MEWPHDQSKVSTQHQKEVVKAIVVDLGGVLFAEGSSEAADVLSRRYGYDKNVVLGVFRSHESIALRLKFPWGNDELYNDIKLIWKK